MRIFAIYNEKARVRQSVWLGETMDEEIHKIKIQMLRKMPLAQEVSGMILEDLGEVQHIQRHDEVTLEEILAQIPTDK